MGAFAQPTLGVSHHSIMIFRYLIDNREYGSSTLSITKCYSPKYFIQTSTLVTIQRLITNNPSKNIPRLRIYFFKLCDRNDFGIVRFENTVSFRSRFLSENTALLLPEALSRLLAIYDWSLYSNFARHG